MEINKHIRHKKAFLVWLAIYPLITILFWWLGDYLAKYPLAIRTLILTVIAVPIVAYLILPFYNKLFANWIKGQA